MTEPPRLTDRPALDRMRRRAAATGPVLFLQEAAADDVQERLAAVNRKFTSPAIVTPWPDLWRERQPQATTVPDSEVLGLQQGQHDLVIHALSLHWADDPIGQLVQCRRALKPDGLLLVTLFGGQTLHELRTALAEAESRATGGLSPRVLPMAELRDLGGLLQRAGFALPVADTMPLRATYRDVLHLLQDLRGMGETNAMWARHRTPLRRDILPLLQQIYHNAFAEPDGRLPATFEIVTLTGWAPSADQQKPLRPGSASHRLADVLGTDEVPLEDGND
ncbi:MAG: methyltransferase domain-containing protein [Alphaproteobacteria bacterium]|jgi:SAM-dependent methyltransferase|nr:methyltransferase domain-containing protein [Alphaproteobacteria bacterium]